jgi:hypothetical protein
MMFVKQFFGRDEWINERMIFVYVCVCLCVCVCVCVRERERRGMDGYEKVIDRDGGMEGLIKGGMEAEADTTRGMGEGRGHSAYIEISSSSSTPPISSWLA